MGPVERRVATGRSQF